MESSLCQGYQNPPWLSIRLSMAVHEQFVNKRTKRGKIFLSRIATRTMVHPFIFYFLMVLTLGCAIAVVTVRNIFHAGLFLIGSFLGVAGFYLSLNNFFLAAVQLLIYSGAIAVLILFGIMMTQRGKPSEGATHNSMWWIAILASAAALKILAGNYASIRWEELSSVGRDILSGIGQNLMQASLLPFELISLVLLAALVGAVALAKEKEDA